MTSVHSRETLHRLRHARVLLERAEGWLTKRPSRALRRVLRLLRAASPILWTAGFITVGGGTGAAGGACDDPSRGAMHRAEEALAEIGEILGRLPPAGTLDLLTELRRHVERLGEYSGYELLSQAEVLRWAEIVRDAARTVRRLEDAVVSGSSPYRGGC